MQTTLGGTLFVYQGEEVGMRNAPTSWPIEEFKDIETINCYKKCRDLYSEDDDKLAYGRKIIDMKARDHSRTPMQWSDQPNAGFCDPDVKPWMRVIDDYKTINVEAQMKANSLDDLSVWQFWQKSLHTRKDYANVFMYGDFEELDPQYPKIYAYIRTSQKDEKWLVVLNFSGDEMQWWMPAGIEVDFWSCSNYAKHYHQIEKSKMSAIQLRPWESILGRCVK